MKGISVLALSAILASGCASSRGFNKDSLRQSDGGSVVTESEIKKALSAKPQLPRKFKIGVFFSPAGRTFHENIPWRWTSRDKDKILAMGDSLKRKEAITDVFFINSGLTTRFDLKSLRMVAAQSGADALLNIQGGGDIDEYANSLAASYILVLPMFFIHGTNTDGLFLAQASLWDVRNGFLYMSSEGEGSKSRARPAAFTEERDLIEMAKEDALDSLASDLQKRLAAMAK